MTSIFRIILRPACWLGVHDYVELKRLSDFSHLVGCRNCSKRWGMNTDAQVLVPWDLELEDHHRAMGHI